MTAPLQIRAGPCRHPQNPATLGTVLPQSKAMPPATRRKNAIVTDKKENKGTLWKYKTNLTFINPPDTSFCSYKSTVAGRGRSFMVGRFRSCTIPLLQGGKRIATLQACIRHLQGVQQLTTMALASWIKTPREHRMTQRVSPN